MTNGDREGRIFVSHPHTNNGFFFLLTTKYWICILEKHEKGFQKIWIPWNETWWHQFNITMTSQIDMQLFVFYLSHGLVRVCEINRIHHWCSVRTGKSQPEGWDVSGTTENQWSVLFSHIPRPYGTVLCNICWWRHWDRCLQSMTCAVQINLKRRINSALNNEQMDISSK